MLETKPLHYFIAVAEERHFTRAAARLCITQSALSVQISKLEAHLGAQLLNRSKRSAVRLTVAGALFLEEARKTLAQLEHTENIGRRAGRGEIGHINIGYVASASLSGALPKVLRRFRQQMPDASVKLAEIPSPQQLPLLSNHQLDVAFLRPRPDYPAGIRARTVHRDALIVALPDSHPATTQPAIGISQLQHERLITPQFGERAGFEQQVDALLGTQRESQETVKVSEFLTSITLVAAGYGVAIVPDCVRRLAINGVVYLPLDQDARTAEQAKLAIAWREAETSASVLAFLRCANVTPIKK